MKNTIKKEGQGTITFNNNIVEGNWVIEDNDKNFFKVKTIQRSSEEQPYKPEKDIKITEKDIQKGNLPSILFSLWCTETVVVNNGCCSISCANAII